jgi:hypothetical protein
MPLMTTISGDMSLCNRIIIYIGSTCYKIKEEVASSYWVICDSEEVGKTNK